MTEPSSDHSDETALSAAHQAKDAAHVEKLLAKHRPYLIRVVEMRMNPRINSRVDASDVVQEAQIEATRRMEEFLKGPEVPVKIWLRRLAIDRLIMAERKHLHAERRAIGREHQPKKQSANIANLLVGGPVTPSRIVRQRDTADTLRSALDQLKASDREIIFMHLYEGLTSQESAAVLDIEPAAARKRLGRAIQRLRKVLDDRGLGASSL